MNIPVYSFKFKFSEIKIRIRNINCKFAHITILIQDKKGAITFWNQGAGDMYGYTESEALKMNIKDMIQENSRRDFLALIGKAFTGKLFDSLETKRVTRTGEIIKVWVMVLALRD